MYECLSSSYTTVNLLRYETGENIFELVTEWTNWIKGEFADK